MAEIINLRQARKVRARAEKARLADANRAKFGRTRAERQVQRQDQDRLDRALDGAKRDMDGNKPE